MQVLLNSIVELGYHSKNYKNQYISYHRITRMSIYRKNVYYKYILINNYNISVDFLALIENKLFLNWITFLIKEMDVYSLVNEQNLRKGKHHFMFMIIKHNFHFFLIIKI